jgi:hypothetical protein
MLTKHKLKSNEHAKQAPSLLKLKERIPSWVMHKCTQPKQAPSLLKLKE